MSKGDDKRQKPGSTHDFPKRSQSVHPPPWMQAGKVAANATVRTVNFADPHNQNTNTPDPAQTAAAQAEAAERAAAEAQAREAERKAEQERRVREELTERSQRLAQAITEAAALRSRLLQETESQLLELAVSIASAIVEREIEIDPEVHGRLAQAALACLGPSDRATLRASKAAYDAIVEHFGSANVRVDNVQVQVVSDPALTGFGCVVENADTRIDARVQSRLKEVLDGLRHEQGRSSEEAA